MEIVTAIGDVMVSKAFDMGCRLMTGLEVAYQRGKTDKQAMDTEVQLCQAVDQLIPIRNTPHQYQPLHDDEFDAVTASVRTEFSQCSQLHPIDSDAWLYMSPDELEREMEARMQNSGSTGPQGSMSATATATAATTATSTTATTSGGSSGSTSQPRGSSSQPSHSVQSTAKKNHTTSPPSSSSLSSTSNGTPGAPGASGVPIINDDDDDDDDQQAQARQLQELVSGMQRFMESESGLEGVDIGPTKAQGPGLGQKPGPAQGLGPGRGPELGQGEEGDFDDDNLEIDFDRVLRLIDGNNHHASNGNTEEGKIDKESAETTNKDVIDPLSKYFYAEDLQPLSPDDSDDEVEEDEKDHKSVPTLNPSHVTVSPSATQRQGLAPGLGQGLGQGSAPTATAAISPSHQGVRRFNLPSIDKELRSEEKDKAVYDEAVVIDSDDEIDDDDDNDDATDGEGVDGDEGSEMNAAFFDEYQRHMDRELASSTLFETFERQKDVVGDATVDGTGKGTTKVKKSGEKSSLNDQKQMNSSNSHQGEHNDEEEDDEEDEVPIAPVDDEFNLLKNLLESRASQLGAAGPATQLLSQLGIQLPPLPPMGRQHQQQNDR